jgi:D-glycero-D-manno-heptose 1,7-bisphosphate phosphatase
MVFDPVHGTLDSPRRTAQVKAMSHGVEFLEGIRALGYQVVVVTNQPGISKGTLTVGDLDSVNDTLATLLKPAFWDLLKYCPHHPEFGTDCECRKPKPGMLIEVAAALDIDLSGSWMVGDGLVDVQAGRQAGCRTVLVTKLQMNTVERFFDLSCGEPDFVASNLREALELIASNGEIVN